MNHKEIAVSIDLPMSAQLESIIEATAARPRTERHLHGIAAGGGATAREPS